MKKIAISVNPFRHKLEFKWPSSVKEDASPALRATDYKGPLVVWEIEYERDIRSESEQG